MTKDGTSDALEIFRSVRFERPLDPLETLMLKAESVTVNGNSGYLKTYCGGFEYKGILDENAISKAFRLLSLRYPSLRGRVRETKDGKLILFAAPEEFPDVVVKDGDESTFDHEAILPWDASRGLGRLLVIRGDDAGYVVIQFTHAIADKHTVFRWLADLWEIYTGILNKDVVRSDVADAFEASSYEHLDSWQHSDPGGHIDPAKTVRKKSPEEDIRIHNGRDNDKKLQRRVRIWLTEQQTAGLRKAARDHGTTVHALISGAVASTLRDQSSSTALQTITIRSVVDLRKYTSPSFKSDNSTNCISVSNVELHLPRNSDALEVGRTVKDRLEADISEHRLAVKVEDHLRIQKEISSSQALAVGQIANDGVFPNIQDPPGLRLIDLVIPSLTDDSLSECFHVVITFRDRLSVWIWGPSGYDDLNVYANKFKECLVGLK